MSSVASVASSFSSFESSSSSSSTQAATRQPPLAELVDSSVGGDRCSDPGERYSDDSFAAADDEPEPTAVTAASACRTTQDRDEYDEEDYGDDAFEDPDDLASHGNDVDFQTDYSADFAADSAASLSAAALAGDEIAPGSNGSDQMETKRARDQSTQQPGDDVVHFAEEWALHKAQLIERRRVSNSQKHNSGSNRNHTASLKAKSATPIHKDPIAGLMQRLATKKKENPTATPLSAAVVAEVRKVPVSMVERARVQHLLALSALSPPRLALPPPLLAPPTKHPLSTFCSVKSADVAGRLATTRLSGLCATWHVPPDCGENAMSSGVMEFIASVTKEQRRQEVLQGDDDCIFQAMQTQTVTLERTAQVASDALLDSRALRKQAQRILHAPDAHRCSCV